MAEVMKKDKFYSIVWEKRMSGLIIGLVNLVVFINKEETKKEYIMTYKHPFTKDLIYRKVFFYKDTDIEYIKSVLRINMGQEIRTYNQMLRNNFFIGSILKYQFKMRLQSRLLEYEDQQVDDFEVMVDNIYKRGIRFQSLYNIDVGYWNRKNFLLKIYQMFFVKRMKVLKRMDNIDILAFYKRHRKRNRGWEQ